MPGSTKAGLATREPRDPVHAKLASDAGRSAPVTLPRLPFGALRVSPQRGRRTRRHHKEGRRRLLQSLEHGQVTVERLPRYACRGHARAVTVLSPSGRLVDGERTIAIVPLRKPNSSASGEKRDRQIAAGACQPSGRRLATRADLDAARVAGLPSRGLLWARRVCSVVCRPLSAASLGIVCVGPTAVSRRVFKSDGRFV